MTSAWRYPAAVGFVVTATLVADIFYRMTGSSRLSMIFLLPVLLSAFLLGSGPAYVAGAVSFGTYLFLVDPRYELSFGSPEDFNTLFVFSVVAGLTGLLAGRMRDEAARSRSRAEATEALLDATREFSDASDETFIRERLAQRLSSLVHGPAFVSDEPGVEKPGWRVRPLAAGESELGCAAWSPARGLSSDEAALAEVLVDTGAAAVARARLAAGKTEAETRARTEDLRNALLSSISHDLRTPLAAILASASSLHQFGEQFAPDVRQDLAATIQEEAQRLDTFVANLLNMTRLEAGGLAVQRAAFNLPEVIARTVERRTTAGRHPVLVSTPPDLPEALGDPVLFEQALGNVLENALRYTPAGSPVLIAAATERGGQLCVNVKDEGPGVPPEDIERIFVKFFRSPGTARKPGTGLGLSIARGLMEAMGGQIEARNRQDDTAGLSVTMRLEACP
ncbi:sensor histidine kinase [Phenylobacterium deserti]|uniref:sensor histidine kinase n=1 Tax=Phenylobacterium deserti TaxID=1914756 RepID=UPI001057CB23|nr:ATP-binding protein [Phenylobacterium deserti]